MNHGAARGDWLMLVAFVLVCFGAGAVGSWFTTPALDGWYADLRKPTWNPPNWIFAPVWSALYLMMAIAAWLVWRKGGFGASGGAMTLFAAQLILNVAWSALFFGLR
ncbi:MAG TPA: TspO/MBR family protein, partial [bacterium]